MAATISVNYVSNATVTETFTGDYIDSGDNTTRISGLNTNTTLTASTAVPVTKATAYQLTLSSGTGSINLAALPGLTADETIVGTGLKVQVAKFRNLAANANTINVVVGASNGYNLLGSDFSCTLAPGQEITIYGNEATPDVASGARLLDVTGTGSQILEVEFVLG